MLRWEAAAAGEVLSRSNFQRFALKDVISPSYKHPKVAGANHNTG